MTKHCCCDEKASVIVIACVPLWHRKAVDKTTASPAYKYDTVKILNKQLFLPFDRTSARRLTVMCECPFKNTAL